MKKTSKISSSRHARLMSLGKLAGGIATGMVSEGARQISQGKIPRKNDLILTPSNAKRVSNKLSQLRGAAMKVGQLLSMEAGEFLPPELTEMLANLRQNAHQMPLGEVNQVLKNEWGSDWTNQFKRFNFTPLAAASIGQVHEAETQNGQRLAIKLQYPGIRQSIDSDVDNVRTLLETFRLIPADFELAPLLEEAKRQLHVEADYRHEATQIDRFNQLLANDETFVLPQVEHVLTTSNALVMTYLTGEPIEKASELPTQTRNHLAHQLADLALREILRWGLVQTDPNFANYRLQADKLKIGLLDFGATRVYSRERRTGLQQLLQAGLNNDDQAIHQAAIAAGYLKAVDEHYYEEGVLKLIKLAFEPLRTNIAFTPGRNNLARDMSEIVAEMRLKRKAGRLPHPDILFLHRKIAGTYLLCAKLNSSLKLGDVVEPYLD